MSYPLAEKIVRYLNGPTDEDVERVATALLQADLLAAEEDAGAAARVALSAYLDR